MWGTSMPPGCFSEPPRCEAVLGLTHRALRPAEHAPCALIFRAARLGTGCESPGPWKVGLQGALTPIRGSQSVCRASQRGA